jgi:hypothetical protein
MKRKKNQNQNPNSGTQLPKITNIKTTNPKAEFLF